MESILACVRRIVVQTVIGVFICGIGVYFFNQVYLIVPVIAGCLVGATCWFVVSYRILKSADLRVDEAKKSMRFGWFIRLLLIMGTLIAAIQISVEIFWAVVAGLFLISVIMMLNAIVYAYNSKC